MGLRLRMGPVSVSSRGRIGVRAGPLSMYSGGSRRRTKSGGWGLLGLLLAAAIILSAAIQYWMYVLPALIVATVIAFKLRTRGRARRAEAHARWLAAPPPPLELPGRFTQNWIASNVPRLHPGQVPVL